MGPDLDPKLRKLYIFKDNLISEHWIFDDIKELLFIFRYNKDTVVCINTFMDSMVSGICFKIIQDENK